MGIPSDMIRRCIHLNETVAQLSRLASDGNLEAVNKLLLLASDQMQDIADMIGEGSEESGENNHLAA